MVQRVGVAVLVIEEIKDLPRGRAFVKVDPHELTIGVVVMVDQVSGGLGQPQTLGIVGVGDRGSAVGCGSQLPALLPIHRPPGAVVVAGGVARTVVGDALPVVSREQIAPVGIAVSVAAFPSQSAALTALPEGEPAGASRKPYGCGDEIGLAGVLQSAANLLIL